ncbi:unnamed protein product [Adineta ricciae]|uniref:C2H2-type domain-containing protein n=1 Tax=Adineta ricciae TaxID=249248 RepID=A0A814H2N0_ADIRI|nr:unnamed protein product [Adineta ricciae]
MNSSSSPPVLYLEDDGGDDDNQIYQTSLLNDLRLPRKKRKLTNANVQINSSDFNLPKRQRNDDFHRQSSQTTMDSELDAEPILLDPDEYIIEEPDTAHSFCSFDWTIQPRTPPPPLLPPPSLPSLPARMYSSSIQTPSRLSSKPSMNATYATKRHPDKLDRMPNNNNSHDRHVQQSRNPISMSVPPATPPHTSRSSVAVLPLPLPKPTASFAQPNTRRGRPTKNSRVPYPQDTTPHSPMRHRSEPNIYSQAQQALRTAATTVQPPPPSPTPSSSSSGAISGMPTMPSNSSNNHTSEIRRQTLNGTGLFSAFHDSKYYQCNICKFKSVTSSTLLQHLFTHMFFCDQCSFYTYSHYSLTQHMFEKHLPPVTEHARDFSNPKSFDLLYVTRCPDGTFALCMDSSPSAAASTNKATTTVEKRLILSSAIPNDQQQQLQSQQQVAKLSKPKQVKEKKSSNTTEDNDIVLLSPEKRDTTTHRSVVQHKTKEKPSQNYISIKYRRTYSLKKPFSCHALTLEYDICREHMIRLMCNTQDTCKRRKYLNEFQKTRLIDEVADCLRTVVNDIIDNENNSAQSTMICALPSHVLGSILSKSGLDEIMSSLKLNNKHEQYQEQKMLYDREHLMRENRKNTFVITSPDTNHSEQSIITSLHSSMTNGDSIFTQTKITKTPIVNESLRRYAQRNPNVQPQTTVSKPMPQKKTNVTQSSSPSPLPRPNSPRLNSTRLAIPKSSRSVSNSSIPSITDRNNNTIPTSHPKVAPSKCPRVITLD